MDCAHHLVGAGICEQVHGHTYRVEAQWESHGVEGERLRAEKALEEALGRFDHQDLNLHFEFPSAENIAQALALQLEAEAPGLDWVKIWEGAECWAQA